MRAMRFAGLMLQQIDGGVELARTICEHVEISSDDQLTGPRPCSDGDAEIRSDPRRFA